MFRETPLLLASITGASCLLSLYLAELFLILFQPYLLSAKGMNWLDQRTVLEIILHERGAGRDAFPAAHPRQMMDTEFSLQEQPVVPLGGAPNVLTVACNEWGEVLSYTSDRYGFPNPSAVWDAPLELALIGDSFTQGFCVNPDKHFSSVLRAYFPRTVNLGNSGNGPLVELATIREYLSDRKPEKVLWFYYEGNDFEDLSRELVHPVVGNYYNNGMFSQKLKQRSEELGNELKRFLDEKIALEVEKNAAERIADRSQDLSRRFWEWIKLYNIRARLGLADIREGWSFEQLRSEVPLEEVKSAFQQILFEAHARVRSWNGQLLFVYLPSWRQFAQGDGFNPHPYREFVLQSVAQLGIPSLDLSRAFHAHTDPLELFPHRSNLHYNHDGYALVADELVRFLKTISPDNRHRKTQLSSYAAPWSRRFVTSERIRVEHERYQELYDRIFFNPQSLQCSTKEHFYPRSFARSDHLTSSTICSGTRD